MATPLSQAHPGVRLRCMELVTGFDPKTHRRAFVSINVYFGKIGSAHDVNLIALQVAPCNRQRFDGLIDRPGTDGLHFSKIVLTNDSGNSAGYSG